MTELIYFDTEINSELLECLIFMLCGMDTSLLQIGVRNKEYALLINDSYPSDLLAPFEELCINVRIVHKFICKNILCKNTVKGIISEFFLVSKKNYLLKVSNCRSCKDIETIFVSLQAEMILFKGYRFIIDTCRKLEEYEIFDKIRFLFKNPLYKGLETKLLSKTQKDVNNWILHGEIAESLFVGEKEVNYENLEEGFWKSKYYLKKNDTYKDSKKILQCGKINILFKKIYKNLELKISENFILERGICEVFRLTNNLCYEMLRDDIQIEIRTLENYFLMEDSSFYLDLFIDLYNDKSFNIQNEFSIYSKENKKLIHKINLFKKTNLINFTITDCDLNNTIYKLFNQKPVVKNNQSILEFITLNFKSKILSLLLTKKNFLELELIFRFLFILSVIQFFMQKSFNFRFSKLMLCFIQNLKFSIFSNVKRIIFEDIEKLVKDINTKILLFLNYVFLVSSEVSLILSEIINLSFNFISLEKKDECLNLEEFEVKFFLVIRKLYDKLKQTNIDWWLLNTLDCLLNTSILKR